MEERETKLISVNEIQMTLAKAWRVLEAGESSSKVGKEAVAYPEGPGTPYIPLLEFWTL